jgi:hypothetical protein
MISSCCPMRPAKKLSDCAGQNNHEPVPGSRIPVSIACAAMKPVGIANGYGAPILCLPILRRYFVASNLNLACARSIIIKSYASMGICLLPYWPINSCRSFDEPCKTTVFKAAGVAYATYCPFNDA